MTDADTTSTDAPRRRYLKWIIIGAIGLVAVLFGGILLYAYVLNDSPDELDARLRQLRAVVGNRR